MFGEECKGGTVGISIEDLQVATAWMFGVDCKVATEGCILGAVIITPNPKFNMCPS